MPYIENGKLCFKMAIHSEAERKMQMLNGAFLHEEAFFRAHWSEHRILRNTADSINETVVAGPIERFKERGYRRMAR